MFTLKGHLGITRGEVKWNSAPGSALSDSASAPKTENTEINSLQEKAEKALRNFLDFSGDRTDHIIIMSLLKDFQEANKAFAEKNKIAADKLDTTIDVAIGNEKDKIVKDKMLKLRAQRKAELTQAAEKQVKNRDQLKTDIRASQAETRGEVGMTAQSEALVKVLGLDEKKDTAMIEMIKALKDVNIASMMKMIGRYGKDAITTLITESKKEDGTYMESTKFISIREKYGYSSNGALGNTELQSLMKFLEAYSNDVKLQAKLVPVIAAYEFAQPANEFLRASTSVKSLTADAKSVATFLADTPSGRIHRDQLQSALQSLTKRPDFVAQVNRLAGTNFADVASLTTGLKANPELKAKFLDNLYAEVAIFEKGDNAGKVFTGKTLEAVKEKNDSINKLIGDKLTAEITRLTKEAKNTPPDEATTIEAFLKLYEEKGVSFFTGEIRRVGEGMMVNIGERANTAGVGMTWEMFIKGLTLTAGVAIGAAKGIGLTLHYDLLSGRTETETQRINTRLGVGASVSSKFVPFIDAGVSSTDKIKIFGAGRGGLDTTALNVALMQGGGVITLTKLDARADEISQYGERLGAMIGDIATLKSADITVAKITEIMKAKNGGGFKEINPQGVQNFVDKITNRYKALPGIDRSTPQERAWVIRGVIQNEVEKMGLEEKVNDRDGRSYRGFSVGIGQVLGITFPLAALHFGEYQVDYSYVEKSSKEPSETITTRETTPIKYTMAYGKRADGKITTTVTPAVAEGKYTLGQGITRDATTGLFISDKPVTATVGTDGRVTFAQRELTSQETTSVPNPAQFETVGDYETVVTGLFSKYLESANWRQKYATRFAPVRNQLFIDASQAGATFETQMNIKGDKKIQEFLVDFKALNPVQKIQALSILVNENAGVSAHRNYNGKVEYGKVHKLTHSPKLDEIYDANELRLLGLEKDADRQARAILIGEKRTWRENIRKNLDAITTKERPVDNLTADKGFFTFQNFAQDNGGKTQFYDLKSQPTTRILKGSLEKSEKIPLVAGAGLLDAAFKDPRYAQRIEAMLIGVNKVRTGDAIITAPDLQQILAGQEVKGVKLDAPLAIYRAESAVCGNEMITIGKPSFVGKKNETSTPQPAIFEIPGVQEDITPNISVGGVNTYDRVSTIGVSFYGDNGTESTAIITKPGEEQVITTTPGEVKIQNGQVTINGKPIGVANTNGTITIRTGTFRLAPGQTIEHFLGTKGIAIPNQTIITTVPTVQTITSTSVVFKDIKQFTAAFNTLTAIDINDNFTYPR